jgi:hypothetical protein
MSSRLALALAVFLPAPALAFENAPIACGKGSQYVSCNASFDGARLTIRHKHKEGKDSASVYEGCAVTAAGISCPSGRWRSTIGEGGLGPRSIGLKDGLPFAE